MISCGEAEEFSPFGRQHMAHHPKLIGLKFCDDPEMLSYEILNEGNEAAQNLAKEWWTIRKGKDGTTEEELYFSGKTVVWSRGQTGIDGSKTIIKSMTCELPVQQAFFATFYTYPDLPALLGDDVAENPTGTEIPSICIIAQKYLTVYTDYGEYFPIVLPFVVKKAWPMKFGIVLERQICPSEMTSSSDSEDQFPVIYSLFHPLDEINPVLIQKDKYSPHKQMYVKDQRQSLVSTHLDPSICILHSSVTSSVKICKIRRAKQEENLTLLQNSILGPWISGPNTPLASTTPVSRSNTASPVMPSAPTPSLSQPPSTKLRQSIIATHQTPKNLHTQHGHMASLVRNFSPALMRLGTTPSPACSILASKLPKNVLNHSILSESCIEPEPLIPDVCLQIISSIYCSVCPTNSFLTKDNTDQTFICLLFAHSSVLKCYKYELSADNDNISLGNENAIPAKDAVSLSGLNMMVVVDTSNTLLLYTGVVYVCRLHLAGLSTFNSTLFKDFSYLNISSKLNSPLGSSMRRSSLLASSKPSSSAFDLKFETGLSPVVTENSTLEGSFLDDPSLPISSAITCVRDATDYRITLEHSSGNLYRVTLPKMWSSIHIEKSLAALKYVLPKELTLTLVNKWYANRNTPGNDNFSPKSEWILFSKTILSLVGYDVEKLSPSGHLDMSGSISPNIVSKKFRATESGSDSDWEYMLSSPYHEAIGNEWSELLQLGHLEVFQGIKQSNRGSINCSAPLFPHLSAVLYALHLVYEDFKVNTIQWDLSSHMIPCLTQLAADLRASLYLDHYWKDFPTHCSLQGPNTQLSLEDVSSIHIPDYFSFTPPSLYGQIYSIVNNFSCSAFPYIPSVSTSTKNLITLYQLATTNCSVTNFPFENYLTDINPSSDSSLQDASLDLYVCSNDLKIEEEAKSYSIHEKIVTMTDKLGLTMCDVNLMAPALSLLLLNAQHNCTNFPPQNWPASAYQLINRPDLYAQKLYAEQCKIKKDENLPISKKSGRDPYKIKVYDHPEEAKETQTNNKLSEKIKEEEDGMETLDFSMLALRWPEDQRVKEVRQMLCSSRPVTISITQKPGVSDHDFLEEQERQLYALCIRTMALPMGRGMFTLCTYSPIITEALPIAPLNLKGKAPPRGTTIEFPINEVPADMDMWPLFHNGVSAGLKITPNCGEITSTWIVYNKPKGDPSQALSHAGFLMALGLNGHLKSFATVSLHEYLSQGHELACVGLLIGISAAMRGSMDRQTTKVLSVHLECLLPPTSTELDVPHNVQVAAILGVGLVYAGTGHRHMMEVLLQEIGRPPGPEMENSNDRESYSLAAGFGLGLIMFGKGSEFAASSDLNLSEELHHYIEGGHRKPLNAVMKERYKSPSYQIKEGDRVNINVTSPGATMALGMVYFKSGNKAIADWMKVPNTPYLLDQVRPDFLLLRTIARGLIMWDEVMPSYKWVEGHVPTTILQHVHRGGSQSTPGIDYESIHQAYYNILAGACFVLGLKFAGSANSEAFYVLWKYTRMFTNFTKRSIAELAGKSTIETCLCSILLSLSMVMAGTGDLEVLRLIRFLRSRVGITVSTVGYGSHMAIHMSLGFLFLGGGRFSLGTSNMSLGALIVSCFPKFPTHSNDNRYHLQAFRHLYVLAAEPRLFLPVDVDTGKLRIADILLRFSDTKSYKDQEYVARAPHMLPELSKLQEIVVSGDAQDARYWPVRFTRGTDSWRVLETLLSTGSGVLLKLREGRSPYGKNTPMGCDYGGSYLLSKENLSHWMLKSSALREIFGCSANLISCLVSTGVESNRTDDRKNDRVDRVKKDEQMIDSLVTIIYGFLYQGKPEMVYNWVNALQALRKVSQLNYYSGLQMWQIKLMSSASYFINQLETSPSKHSSVNVDQSPKSRHVLGPDNSSKMALDDDEDVCSKQSTWQPLVSSEKFGSLLVKLNILTDSWEEDIKAEMYRYIGGDFSHSFSPKCAFTLLLKDVPPSQKNNFSAVSRHPLSILREMKENGVPLTSSVALVKQILSIAKE